MADIKQHVLLKRGFGKTPIYTDLLDGELAIDISKDSPTIFFKTIEQNGNASGLAQIKPGALADWSATSGLSSIKNKPSTVVTKIEDRTSTSQGQQIGITVTSNTNGIAGIPQHLSLKVGVPEADDFTTDKTWGNIPQGTKASDLKLKTLSELLDWALFREIDPTVNDPSVSVSWAGPASVTAYSTTPAYTNVKTTDDYGLVSRGKKPDGTIVTNQRRSPSVLTQSLTIGGLAMSLTNWEAKTKRTIEFGDNQILKSGVNIIYAANFESSNITPVTNKNNPKGTPFGGGDKVYTLSSISIKGLVPWFATAENIVNMNSQGNVIDTWSKKVLTFTSVAEETGHRAAFLVGGKPGPEGSTTPHGVSKIEFYDSVTREYVEDTLDWTVLKIQTPVNGTNCQWYKFTHNGSGALKRGITTIRISMSA